MKRKRIRQILLGSGAMIILSGAILFLHIYQATHKPKAAQIQLSRIDFRQDIDSAEALRIRSFVNSLPGVKHTHFNVQDNILVYTYTIGAQNSLSVYNALMAHGHYKADRYQVSAEEATKGCPIFTNDGLGSKLVSFISKL